MDFIIIVVLIFLVIWFILGPESKIKAWFNQRFKQFYSLLGKRKYQKQHKVRAADEKPSSQSSSKNVSTPEVEVSNQNTKVQINPVDPRKIVAYPIIMRDHVGSLIKHNPSWLQVVEINELLQLIENEQQALSEKIEAISHHATESQLRSQKLVEPYGKVSDKLFSLISQIDTGNLSNLYEVKEQLIDFKSHFKSVSHVCENLLKSTLIKQLPSEPGNPLAEKVEQIIKEAKGDILKLFSKLIELSKSDVYISANSEKESKHDNQLVGFIEKLLSLDLSSTKNFSTQLSEIPKVNPIAQQTHGNTNS